MRQKKIIGGFKATIYPKSNIVQQYGGKDAEPNRAVWRCISAAIDEEIISEQTIHLLSEKYHAKKTNKAPLIDLAGFG